MRTIATQSVIDRGERSGASAADRQAADALRGLEAAPAAADAGRVPFDVRVDAAAKTVHLRWGGMLDASFEAIRAICRDAITAADQAAGR